MPLKTRQMHLMLFDKRYTNIPLKSANYRKTNSIDRSPFNKSNKYDMSKIHITKGGANHGPFTVEEINAKLKVAS